MSLCLRGVLVRARIYAVYLWSLYLTAKSEETPDAIWNVRPFLLISKALQFVWLQTLRKNTWLYFTGTWKTNISNSRWGLFSFLKHRISLVIYNKSLKSKKSILYFVASHEFEMYDSGHWSLDNGNVWCGFIENMPICLFQQLFPNIM